MSGREPAWRVVAHELNSSLHEERGSGDRAASYVLSPMGARMNRLLVVGTLSAPESVGTDPTQPFLRARLSDPTGSLTVTGGGFQPRALAALQQVHGPGRFLVVGKAHLFHGRNEVAYPSVRAEALRPISEDEFRRYFLQALQQSLQRVELLEEVAAGRATPADPATPPRWWAAARIARQRYPSGDPTAFRSMIAAALAALDAPPPPPTTAPAAPSGAPVTAPGHARITRLPPTPATAPVSAAGRAEESAFLDIVDDLADRSSDGYADLHDALGAAGQRGVSAAVAEELLNRLEETGVLEEPIVGKIRRA